MATRNPAPSQAVARPAPTTVKERRDALKEELAGYVPSYQNLLPPGYSAERLVTGALVAVTANPDLLKCTTLSIALALAQVAQWGLDVGSTAHLVPFNVKVSKRNEPDRYESRCTAIADYKGYIELMCGAGARKVEARVVREGDAFEYQYGTEPFLKHYPKSETGKITHAYAIIWVTPMMTQFEVMTVEEIEEIRKDNSKQWKGGTLPTWYARKTVVRRLVKYVPKRTARLQALADKDELTTAEVDAALVQRLEPGQESSGHVALKSGAYDDSSEARALTPEEEEDAARQEEMEMLQREGRL